MFWPATRPGVVDQRDCLTVSRLDERLDGLNNMTPAQLRAEWQRLYRTPAPRVSLDLLARGIAWQWQERALGGFAPAIARELKRLGASGAVDRAASDVGGKRPVPASSVSASPPLVEAADLRPGTTLMRSWGGRSWSVLVTENGLVFEGRQYDSLSKIARDITGAHWSGPRFFGLRNPSTKASGAGVGRGKRAAQVPSPKASAHA